jgi:hypothetical protein
MDTTIKLKIDVKNELGTLKLVEEETYNSVIKRLIQKYKEDKWKKKNH